MKRFMYSVLSIGLLSVGVSIWLGYEIDKGTEPQANGTKDYLIVLGAKVNAGGVPSLSLANRLDVAARYLHEHPYVTAIVSGGQGADEDRTEASVMFDVLVEKGIAPERILIEDQSTSTYENLRFSKLLLPDEVTEITIVSNDFHLRRASYLANTLGLEADVVAAPTPQIVETKSRLRERLALAKTFMLGQ